MNLLKKAVLFYKKEGIKSTLVRVAQKLWEVTVHFPGRVQEIACTGRYIRQVAEKSAGKDVYVVIPCIDWNIPLFQRPHQIAISLAQQPNAHVFFVSDEYRYDNFPGIQPVNPNLDLVSCRIADKLRDALSQANHVTVFMCWPRHARLLEHIPYDKLVYEYIDDLSLIYYYTGEMRKKHYELIQTADLTVCTARALLEDAKPFARKVLLSPNAGDYDFFHDNRNCAMEPSLPQKIKPYQCVLGYYGCLATWFDYDLVIEVAKRRPDWCFVLVGYCFDGTISRLQEAKMDNIILYPAQPYQKLPSFIAGFDIQTIPFVINDITNATSPVKLFEYMAAGKPILTSALPECLQYRSVSIYQNADDFIEKAEHLMKIRQDADYIDQMDEEARNNTWKSRINEILNALYGGN